MKSQQLGSGNSGHRGCGLTGGQGGGTVGKKGNGCTMFLEMITSCPARVSIFRTEAKVVKLEL